MTKFFKDFARDESGASAAEYALILAIVGLGIVAGATYLQGTISDSMCNTADTIDEADTGTVYNTSTPCTVPAG